MICSPRRILLRSDATQGVLGGNAPPNGSSEAVQVLQGPPRELYDLVKALETPFPLAYKKTPLQVSGKGFFYQYRSNRSCPDRVEKPLQKASYRE